MRQRRAIAVFSMCAIALVLLGAAISTSIQAELQKNRTQTSSVEAPLVQSADRFNQAKEALETLVVKGRAAKTGYARTEFGNGWAKVQGCSTRDIILYRDLANTMLEGECRVVSGTLDDPYTAKEISFSRERSAAIQIDHVVALSNAWQTGAQQLTKEQRVQLANDPLELLAVDGPANQEKGDGDAATWLPKNKAFRCEYIERQIKIKLKYSLWVTPPEKAAMAKILEGCVS